MDRQAIIKLIRREMKEFDKVGKRLFEEHKDRDYRFASEVEHLYQAKVNALRDVLYQIDDDMVMFPANGETHYYFLDEVEHEIDVQNAKRHQGEVN